MSRLRELVGRSRSEDDLASLLVADADETWTADWDGDWDGDWAATQARDGAAEGAPDAAAPAPQESPAVENSADDGSADEEDTPRPARARRRHRRPPGRRGPILLVLAVVGALFTALLGGTGDSSTPVASGQDYGLGLADTGFAGGVGDARGEISQAEAQARLGEIAASRAAREPDFVVPTDGRLTTCFCTRWGTMHWGIDLAAPLGTPIVAAADGVVLRAGPASGYGYAIYIQDADGNVEIYGHMRYMYVEAGDVVSAGDLIAKVGNQGQSTGPHLHFEIHQGGMNGRPTDPQAWLAERGLSVQ